MATNTMIIGMNRLEKPGQQTREEVLTALRAQGIPVTATSAVFDPLTGQLIQATISFPDTANAAATAAVNANTGVATTTAALPPTLLMLDLTGVSAPPLSFDPPRASQITIWYAAAPDTYAEAGGSLAGTLYGTASGNTYFDEFPNNNGGVNSATLIFMFNNGTSAYEITDGSLTFEHSGGMSVSVDLSATVSIAATEGKYFYIGADGKMYLAVHITSAGYIISRTYAQAVEAGAL
jgi:hypothetical protein